MKTLLFSFASVALGFTAARLLPVSPPDAAASVVVKKSELPPSPPARTLDLAGNWKPAAESWAAEDPAGCYAWLVKRGIPPDSALLSLLFSTWAGRDADAAFTAFFDLPSDYRRRDMVLSDLLLAIFNKPDGWKSIFKWLPQVDAQINSYRHPETEWTRSAPPKQMAALLLASCSSGHYSSTLISQFAAEWARQDRVAAMAWMKSLRPDLHRDAFSGIMDDWAEQDPVAALDYLATQADSGERGNAFAPLSKLAKKDPKAAFA